MIKRLIVVALALVIVGGIGLTWRRELPLIAPPIAASFDAAQVALGEQLAGVGNCAGCHTVPGGAAYAGGLGLETGFGLAYSTNITPDVQTGIGDWPEEAFARALREGVARDGSHLLPAFPYTHFTKVSDDDARALYAFLMTRAPVNAPDRQNTIPFPYNIRPLLAGWKLLFLIQGTYQNVPAKSAAWNRGAYLAEGLGHCAACHTPRNRFGAEQRAAPYAGAKVDGWLAPALDASNPAPMPWTQQDLYDYLRTGESEVHGVAAGSMAQVVHQGLAKLPDADVQAIALYFADGNGSAARVAGAGAVLAQSATRRLVDVGRETEPGANLYLAACAYCHYSGAPKPGTVQGSLALSSAVTADDPANFIHIVLGGIGGAGAPGPYMPGSAAALTDADIATLAAYVRRTRTDRQAWPDLQATVTSTRQHANAPP